ncbi:hypothetical protein AAFF_G00250860 [Aldrovandia affinis]|uniref:Uncharacterized protein n=1 Tax=Aldrovandia affinis TaxID=143900 RepID=A0AAD7W2K0_9TELE|nr:hypothetical protein AAFF_G00250860 [Aldrovandia affinis]
MLLVTPIDLNKSPGTRTGPDTERLQNVSASAQRARPVTVTVTRSVAEIRRQMVRTASRALTSPTRSNRASFEERSAVRRAPVTPAWGRCDTGPPARLAFSQMTFRVQHVITAKRPLWGPEAVAGKRAHRACGSPIDMCVRRRKARPLRSCQPALKKPLHRFLSSCALSQRAFPTGSRGELPPTNFLPALQNRCCKNRFLNG